MIELDPAALDRRALTALGNGLVAPRPIAWVSSRASDGTPNLAPFSFFNCFSTAPFTIGIGPGSRSGVHKDTLANIKATGEFTISMVTEELATTANLSSADLDSSVDEWGITGLTQSPSTTVSPPWVGESPAALECRVFEIVDLGEPDAPTNSLVIARVTCIHVSEDVISPETYAIDPEAIGLVARMGGDLWCTTRNRFELRRPDVDETRLRVQTR
jgi:flavin reductase (DIM6/NTAB) family NADH-FMN oxidoreductase RutF